MNDVRECIDGVERILTSSLLTLKLLMINHHEFQQLASHIFDY
jgi:hypothetical protein